MENKFMVDVRYFTGRPTNETPVYHEVVTMEKYREMEKDHNVYFTNVKYIPVVK